MANMNLKDALNKALRTTKQYIDKAIEEKGFSGDYNDLENRPCYEDKGDIPEYLNIEIYPDTDFSDKENVEVINGTADNGNCIVYRKYVKLFSDITIDMINTMKEYGVFISKYEGQLIENPLIDILDESQADRGMYFIGLEFEFILQAPEGYYLPENGLWYMESYVDRDLNGNLIAEYKTVDDFNGILLIKDNGKLNTGTIKQLDEKFIPDTIARVENLPYCDTRTTKPATITYDGDYLSKQTVICYEMEKQIECFVRIHDSLSFAEGSDIVAITLGGMYESERINDLVIKKHNEKVTSVSTVDGFRTFLLNIESDTVLNTSDISMPYSIELSLSEGLWAFQLAVKQDLESLSLKENNEANVKGLGQYYVREVEYNKTVKGDFKRVDEQDFLTTKKYVDNAIIKDYNDLENRPCYDSYATVEYIYDGNLTGKALASNNLLVKVSDDVVTYEEFKSATVIFNHSDGSTTTYNMSSKIEGDDYYFSDDGLCLRSIDVCIVYEDGAKFGGVTFPQKGIYFYDNNVMEIDNGSDVSAKVMLVGYTYSLSIKRKEFKQLDEKFIPDTIANNSKYLDYQVENIVINKLLNRNLKVKACSCIYEWDRESGKNSSDLIMEVLELRSNYDYHNLFLKSDTFKETITKPSIYDKDIESYFAIVLNDSFLILNKFCDCEYYGLNVFGYRQGYAEIKNTKDNTVEYALCYYPFSPTVPIDTGYQNFSCNTYDPDSNTVHIAATCKKDSQINNIKIYKVNVFKMINTSFDYTKDIMNFIKDEYGSEYELKFSMVAKVNDRDQNTYNYNSDRYGALMYFQKNTSCIVDWGDGTIEKFKDIKKIDHPYKAGYYHVNIYSKNYLPIHYINDFYDIQINLLDTSEHTSIVNLFYNNATNSFGENQITLNCAVNFSKAQNCSNAFTSITNLNPNVFANATNINNLNNAFCGNSWLTEIPSTLNTSKVTDFYCAFQSMQGVTHIPTLNLSSASRFDAVFFDSCRIKTMDELDFGQGTFTEVDCCFAACHSLIEAKLKNTGRITNFCECFLDCINLEKVSELDISSIDMTEEERWMGDDELTVSGLNSMFHNCYKLKDVKLVGEATADKINAFINELPTNPVEGITRTLDISACTNKNGVTATADTWTIVK